jgi:hypothetical protein
LTSILKALNQEWAATADSPAARHALRRWSIRHPVFTPFESLDAVLMRGYDPEDGPRLRRSLALLAPDDPLAARTLLQAMLGGLCNLARRIGRDAEAVDDVIGLAWERIRTYPGHRPGSVSGNVLLDVRKRYVLEQERGRRQQAATASACSRERSAEELVIAASTFAEVRAARATLGICSDTLETIIRSRVGGESMADLASEQQVSLKVLWHRRWRAEARLRELPLAN